ncbi:MAG TPA: hypothetical protein VHK01_07590 [Lacipirellulaceae bacterium]|nr:hypothetical protein [Lacipirellulaceae bacterium]
MIFRRTVFVGPIIALSLLSGVARSADESAPGPPSSTEEKVDGLKRRPSFEISDDTTTIWRRSRGESTNSNIRFIKPSIPGSALVSAPARALATDGGPSGQFVEHGRHRDSFAAQNASIKRIEAEPRVAARIAPAQVPTNVSRAGIGKVQPPKTDRQLAGATAAKLQQLIEQPKPQIPAVIQSSNQPAEGDGATAVCATTAPTPFHRSRGAVIKDEPNDVAEKQVVQAAASAPRQLFAAGTRLLQGIGRLIPTSGSRAAVDQ